MKTRTVRLSRRVRPLAHAPYTFESGHLYFALELSGGDERYAAVKGKDISYWLNHLLDNTPAFCVRLVKPSEDSRD